MIEPRPAPTEPVAAARVAESGLTGLQMSYLVGRESPVLGGTGCWLGWEFERDEWNMKRLEAAWNKLVDRHETLRTVFFGGASQILDGVPRYAIECLDLREETDEAAARKLAALRDSVFHHHTDPARWPLFRIAAARTRSGMRLFTGFDILVIDAAGVFRLLRELGQLHDDPAAVLPPLQGSFRDVMAAWERRRTPERQAECRRYWTSRLAQLPRAPSLAETGAPNPPPRFRRYAHRLSPQAWETFQRLAAARGVRRVPALMAAFAQVLARWSAHRSFTLNVTSGNHLAGLVPEGVLGDYSINLLLAVDLQADRTFSDHARTIAAQLASDLQHLDMSGVDVVAAMSQRAGEPVLMPVVFSSLLHRHADLAPLGRFVNGLTRTPQVTIDCQLMADGQGLCLSWDVREGVFPDGLIESMFGSWGAVVDRLARDEAAWESTAPAPLPAAQLERREQANATQVAWPAETLHARVLAQARVSPGAVALVAPDRTLTYAEAAGRAAALAQALRAAGAQPGELVAIVLPKGWQQVVAALAVQMAGAAYLPIDRATPPARVAELLRLGGCRLAVADEDVPLAPGVRRVEPSHPPIDEWDAGPATPEDLAYVIFTSGSTGIPKGVMIRHRAAANTVRDINQRYGLAASDRVIGLSSLNFDLSVWDIFGTLSAGAALVLPAQESLRDPDYLKALVEAQGVTVWNSVPSHLQMLAEHGAEPQRLRSLRLAMLSGDWIPVTLPGRVDVPIVSLGGATEASIWSIAYPVEAVDPAWKSIPYGKPLANQRFHVLDDGMDDCPDGIPGELYIAGDGLADGYWGDEALTAASFVTHPRSGERLYRTGDWGRYLPDGNIEFLGRRDGQVKISGHRVELGEVDAAIGRCEGVDSAVAVTFADEHGQKRLAAFYSGTAEAAAVRSRLQELLPPYMVPLRLTLLPALPLTANGKVDRKRLAEQAATPQAQVLPRPQPFERLFGAQGVLREAPARQAFAATASGVRTDLPLDASIPLKPAEELRALRAKSVREFDGVVTLRQLESLLVGLRAVETDGRLQRAYPSAGDTCSVQTYVHVAPARVEGLAGGMHYYHPVRHELVALPAHAAIDTGIHVPANQRMASEAAFTLFFFADLSAIQPLYGGLAEPFAWMEAGHMAQILRQSAADHGLGLCLIGAYDAAPVVSALGLGEQHLPLAAMVGGVPARSAVQRQAQPLAMTVAAPHAASPVAQELEARIAAIWCELLEVPAVGMDDRFFEIGGTSFSMLAVQRLLAERLGRIVSITDLFRHTTVSQLAAHLADDVPAPIRTRAPAPPATGCDELSEKREKRRALRREPPGNPPT